MRAQRGGMDHMGLLHGAAERTMASLRLAGSTLAAQTWLKSAMEKAEGVEEVLELLEDQVENGAMLEKLVAAKSAANREDSTTDAQKGIDVKQQPEGSPAAPNFAAIEGFTEVNHVEAEGAPPVEMLDQYVLVNKGDVLDAIGSFVAAYLVTIPEAQNLQPAELQNALKKTFKELRKSRMRIAWEWGHYAYRAAAMGYGVFSVYENPGFSERFWQPCGRPRE